MKPEITLELDLKDWDITVEEERWASAELLVGTGATLSELIDDARIFFADQDGGEAFDVAFDGSYLTDQQVESINSELTRLWTVKETTNRFYMETSR